MRTRFTRLVGCDLPLQLAVLGGIGTTELAAAVASAGGLGMVPGGVELPAASLGTTGVGFLMPFAPPLDVVTAVARRCRVVEFFYAAPRGDHARAVHDGGALCSWQTGSVEEAVAAEQAGCDFIVAQGSEAGGHVRGLMPLEDILAAAVHAVSTPVVAAGGISTPDAVARIIAAGADAVRIGTCFVAATESAAHPAYLAALIAAGGPQDTVLTTHFDENWPRAPHRVLTAALARAEATGNRIFDPPRRDAIGDVSDRAMYAGEGVGAIHEVRPARAIVDELMGAVA
jgi:NAD(P)H-dependent flavin oxidoreductase YrpB (nitropropane dioxygenase family)